ncbi:Vps52-domain-containing protein [Eremomyces bilateralis CBS 781.70]|uniref:Vps52-domain-containing protein n=1 Tax=Eremomyces bilateralis CBS 781.70 TaxID=1392243 RepID=A0A6G1FQV8_9PEZI|nr:Vps52-domain-containing protein [Eremomyces bilateralis CBS 781.70]KAF1808153.1 Vps52-domain-containing protein [Eremomyces bilateralis CBS 781.70]
MFLDRFSTASPSGTPPLHRSYSPAPRRTAPYPIAPANRPLFNPRSSSLSLASTASSNSTTPAPRPPNGSSLKHELPPSQPVLDPIQVLQSIVGTAAAPDTPNDGKHSPVLVKPAQLARSIDFDGINLDGVAITASGPELGRDSASSEPVKDFEKEKDKFEDLHRSIAACDDVLRSIESYLTGFQADLSTVSAEIESLQKRSATMNTRLENRRVVEQRLGPSVESIAIPPAIVRHIDEGPVDEAFVVATAELEKRAKTLQSRTQDGINIKAMGDVRPLVESTTLRAVERIRDHFVAQVKALRSPNINAQVIQNQGFLKCKDLYAFLARHQPPLAEDIRQAYVNTMRWYYSSHFARYDKALERLKLHVVDKTDAIAQPDDSKRNASKGKPSAGPEDPFTVGRRLDLLKAPLHQAISSYVAEENKSTHYLETPFHAFNLALIDNASFEYSFLTAFFSPSQSFHAISRTFSAIFDPTFAIGQSLTKRLVEHSTDAIGLLLSVRINQHLAFEAQRRKVPSVEGYINATNMLLWPRFQIAIDLHCESLRRATSSLSGRPSSAALLASGTGGSSTAPNPLTQRFAHFTSSILDLSKDAGDDEPLSNSFSRLRNEFELHLTKLGKSIGDERKRARFLFNNYSLIYTVLETSEGRLAEETKSHFEDMKGQYDSVS